MIYKPCPQSSITAQRYTIYFTCKFFVNYFQNIFSGSAKIRFIVGCGRLFLTIYYPCATLVEHFFSLIIR